MHRLAPFPAVRASSALLLLTVVATWIAACASDGDEQDLRAGNIALRVESTEPGPAAREVVAVEVMENGDIACTMADGSAYSGSGHVEFFLQATFHSLVHYGPESSDRFTETAEGAALSLGIGAGYVAQCAVFPDDRIADDLCPNILTGEVTEPCFRSGIYTFDVVEAEVPVDAGTDAGPDAGTDAPIPDDAGTPEPELGPSMEDRLSTSNCGEGSGDREGRYCTGMEDWSTGVHEASFACPLDSVWKVTMTTVSGSTTLRVADADGLTYGTSASVTTHDEIFFTATEDSGECVVTVEVTEPSRFMLRIAPALSAPVRIPADEIGVLILDAGHGSPAESAECLSGDNGLGHEIERGLNELLVSAATRALRPNTRAVGPGGIPLHEFVDGQFVAVFTYDGVVLPWTLSEEPALSEEDMRFRECQIDFGADGYRAYAMRAFVAAYGFDPDLSVAIQFHNDSWNWRDLGVLGSEVFQRVRFGDPPTPFLSLAMTRVGEHWIGERDVAGQGGAFARAATGVMSDGSGGMVSEDPARTARWGAPLRSGVVFEVAHYDFDGNWLYASDTNAVRFATSVGDAFRSSILAYFNSVVLVP